MAFTLHTLEKQQYLSALSQAIISRLNAHIAQCGFVNFCVSGGKSPIALFQHLSTQKIAWDKVYIGLVDERILPTTHIDSNTALVEKYLLHATSAHFTPLLDPNATYISSHATDAESSALDSHASDVLAFALNAYRAPHVAILGMGADGHTASIFPDCKELDTALTATTPLILTTPTLAPYKRISMSLHAILQTPDIFLAIEGEEKFKVLEKALQGISKSYPISYVLHSSAHVHIYHAK